MKTEVSKFLLLLSDRFAKSIIALALSALLARNLNLDQFAKYTKELLWYGLIETFGSCGLTATISVLIVGKSDLIAKRLLVHSILIKALFTAILYLVLLAFDATFGVFQLKFALFSIISLMISCWSLSEGFMIGRGEINKLVVYKTGSLILFFIARILLFCSFGTNIGSTEMIAVFCVEQIFLSFLLLRKNNLSPKFFLDSLLMIQDAYHLFFFGLKSWINLCLIVVYMKIGQVWISIFGTVDEISQFTVALQTVEMSYTLPIVFTTAITKKIVTEQRMESKEQFNLTIGKVLKIGNLVSILGVLTVVYLSRVIFDKVYGPKFLDASRLFSVMILSLPFVTMGGVLNINAVASNRVDVMIKRSLLAGVTAVIITPIVFFKFGIFGVAWSIVIIQLLANFVGNLIFDKPSFSKQIASLRFQT